MLVAQLHHKVPLQVEEMEDVLTSSVFALLRYLPRPLASALLARWTYVPLQPDMPVVDFWPRYPTPMGFGIFLDGARAEPRDRGETEPDVVIRTAEWLVLVEVKYRSHLDPAYDQLGRELAIGHRLAKEEGRRLRLLVVTADVLRPRPGGQDLVVGTQRALARVRDGGGSVTTEMIASVPVALRWISWQRIYKALARTAAHSDGAAQLEVSAHHRRLLEDTCALLELRGLRPYSARRLARAMARWDRAAIPDNAWRSPMCYRYRTTVSLSARWNALRDLDAARLHPVAWQLD
jgi:hypothetical protein